MFLYRQMALQEKQHKYSLAAILPAEALVVICHLAPGTKCQFILGCFIIVVISPFKTKVGCLHVF